MGTKARFEYLERQIQGLADLNEKLSHRLARTEMRHDALAGALNMRPRNIPVRLAGVKYVPLNEQEKSCDA